MPSLIRVYLDNCSLQRPLDSRTQVRITLEAEAVLGLLAMAETGKIELVHSDALTFEIDRAPNPVRRRFAERTLQSAKTHVALDDALTRRTPMFIEYGLKLLDALHLASAEAARAACFCTCDDKLLRRAGAILRLKTRAVSPTELIGELE